MFIYMKIILLMMKIYYSSITKFAIMLKYWKDYVF